MNGCALVIAVVCGLRETNVLTFRVIPLGYVGKSW